MANPQLPLAMLYLSSLSNPLADPSIFPKGLVPPRETNVEDPQLHRMSKVLDAMVYFLPVSKGQVFALSLGVGERVTICVAGNDDSEAHFRTACVNGATPDAMIQSVWDGLRSIVLSEPTSLNSRKKELVAYLFERHQGKMQRRFEKRREQCKLFFELASDPVLVSQRAAEHREFLKDARDIFHYTCTFFDLPQEKRKEAYYALYYRLEEARTSYAKRKDTVFCSWWSLELKVRMKFPSSPSFDLVRYIDKLLSPSVHAARLLNTTRNNAFRKLIRLPLDVIPVPAHPAPSNTLNPPSDQAEIRSFLADCYGEYPSAHQPFVLEILERTSTEILHKIQTRPGAGTFDIQPPHCESTLVHHLLSLGNSASSYPYIAVSKISCLSCGLYLQAACRNYGSQKTMGDGQGWVQESLIRYQTRGCCVDDIRPVALPTGPATTDLDTFVERDMVGAVKGIVRAVLRDLVDKARYDSSSDDGCRPLLIDDDDVEAMSYIPVLTPDPFPGLEVSEN